MNQHEFSSRPTNRQVCQKAAGPVLDGRRRNALLKPPGPSRKVGDLKLIAEALNRLDWIKKLPDPETASNLLAPHVAGDAPLPLTPSFVQPLDSRAEVT